MKKIINGRRYDTDKATMVATIESRLPYTDFHYYEELLYRSPRGGWFLVGAGGALSRWGGGFNGGAGTSIVPLSDAETKQWLESAEETHAIEEYFGDSIEDA